LKPKLDRFKKGQMQKKAENPFQSGEKRHRKKDHVARCEAEIRNERKKKKVNAPSTGE